MTNTLTTIARKAVTRRRNTSQLTKHHENQGSDHIMGENHFIIPYHFNAQDYDRFKAVEAKKL